MDQEDEPANPGRGQSVDKTVKRDRVVQRWGGHLVATNGCGWLSLSLQSSLSMLSRIYPFVFALPFLAAILLAHAPVDSEQAITDLINQMIAARQFESAVALARHAVAQYPASAALDQLLGLALYREGDRRGAAVAFRKAIELAPSESGNYFNLGLIELGAGDARAVKHLEAFVQLEPRNPDGHLLLGHAYQYTNRTLPAVEQYHKALEFAPKLPTAHYHLGLAYESQGDVGLALAEFKQEIDTNPKFCEAYELAGKVEVERDHLNESEHLYRSAVECRDGSFQAHYGLARVLLAKEQFAEAETELARCVKIDDSAISAHYALAQTYQRLGRMDAAEREYHLIAQIHAQRHAHISSGIASSQEARP